MDGVVQDLITWAPRLVQGTALTIFISVTCMALALVLGLLLALGRLSGSRVIRDVIAVYVDVMRGVPLLVTLFILYFGLPTIGLKVSDNAVVTGIVGLSLNLAAYLSEVMRAAIQSVDAGQGEAALSIGMTTPLVYRRIVLPQAFVVAVPTLGGYFISLLKDSSLVSFISATELMRTGVLLVSATFKSMEVYLIVGVVYLALSLIAAKLLRMIERRLAPFRDESALTLPNVVE